MIYQLGMLVVAVESWKQTVWNYTTGAIWRQVDLHRISYKGIRYGCYHCILLLLLSQCVVLTMVVCQYWDLYWLLAQCAISYWR